MTKIQWLEDLDILVSPIRIEKAHRFPMLFYYELKGNNMDDRWDYPISIETEATTDFYGTLICEQSLQVPMKLTREEKQILFTKMEQIFKKEKV